ncbi:hypothetical protein HK104_000563 [Borealophlyctis nickersoniae]|nr:hypothetical protein HK104_000563 [Borealophlyctis nickersoniae]
MPFLATTSNRWWFWSVDAKNVTSAVDTCWCRRLASRAAEDREWLDWSSDSDSDSEDRYLPDPEEQRNFDFEAGVSMEIIWNIGPLDLYEPCCAESMMRDPSWMDADQKLDLREERNAQRLGVNETLQCSPKDNRCLFAHLYSAEVQEKIDQSLSSSAPSAAATLFNDKGTMGHLCRMASEQPDQDLVCRSHLLAIKWSRGILMELDIWWAIGLDLWEEDEIIMQYMRGQPGEDGAKLNIPMPLMVKSNVIAWTAVALQPLNEEVWGQEEEMERLAIERGIRLDEDYDSDVQVE